MCKNSKVKIGDTEIVVRNETQKAHLIACGGEEVPCVCKRKKKNTTPVVEEPTEEVIVEVE